MELTQERMNEIETRLQKATHGEWTANEYTGRKPGDELVVGSDVTPPYGGRFVCGFYNNGDQALNAKADADFIANAKANMHVLLEALKEAKGDIARLRDATKAEHKCLRAEFTQENSLVVTLAYGSEQEEREIGLLVGEALTTLLGTMQEVARGMETHKTGEPKGGTL